MAEVSNELSLTEGDFCRIQAQIIIEVVAACSEPKLTANQRLTDIANRLDDIQRAMPESRQKTVVREIAGILIATE